MSTLWLPPSKKTKRGGTVADWDTYKGNNHLHIETNIRFGGGVSFNRHLGLLDGVPVIVVLH